MMPINHVQSCVCHVIVLADAGTNASNRMLTAVDLTATGVIVTKHFLNVTYSPFKLKLLQLLLVSERLAFWVGLIQLSCHVLNPNREIAFWRRLLFGSTIQHKKQGVGVG